jgi:hypothetical protein
MLTIRTTQLHRLGQAARDAFIDTMLAHVHTHFPELASDQLRSRLNALIERAAVYQLTSQQQVCRFINLAATYGWEFDSDPELLWMRSILTDSSPAQPGERLDRLVQTCLHRQGLAIQNRALHERLGVATPVSVTTNSALLRRKKGSHHDH